MAKGQSTTKRSFFKHRRVHCAVLLAFGPALAMQAEAQTYVNYDGSRTNDLNAAVKTWTGHLEFKEDWGAGGMNAQYAYALGYSGAGVKLGSVDSGVETTLKEFAGRSNIVPVTLVGNYRFAGAQASGAKDNFTWNAGDPFSVPAPYNASFNNYHGTLVAGTMAAAKDGTGTMGMAFGSQLYFSNTHGTDGLYFNKDRDYGYFYQAYGALAAQGVRVINSSWGSQDSAEDYSTVPKLVASYKQLRSANPAVNKPVGQSWLDAAVDVTKATGVIQVFSAGNTGYANASVRGSLPYFMPEMEANWLTVTGLDRNGGKESHLYNSCGVAKYWCIAGPTNTQSTDLTGGYSNFNGTSAAAPHVSGALGVLMERYPSLGNAEIRTILLTTARQVNTLDAATGDAVTTLVPDATYGWGVPDLKKGMNGPGQFLGKFNANLPAGISDTWSNDISEAALKQRKAEEQTEVAAWAGTKAGLIGQLQPVPEATTPSDELVAGLAKGKELLQAAITANTQGVYTQAKLDAALAAVNADPVGKLLLQMYETYKPGWTGPYSLATDFDSFIGGRNDAVLAQDASNQSRTAIIASNAAIQGQIDNGQPRITSLQSKTDADYVGSLVKTGAGTLTLTGNNSYSGGTQLKEGTLGVGHDNALGTGVLAMSDAATLQAAADGLKLGNPITLRGIGNIDTQAFGLTLSGNISDDASGPGGLAKLGSGTLTLSGVNTYSGPTGVMAGTLQAGSATGFSPRSAFVVSRGAQLDLGGFNQTVGSLAGSGNISLGAADLTIGGDGAAAAFSGQIGGAGALTKIGAGAQTLSGANTYTGGTRLKAGRLDVGHGNALGTGALSMDDGTTLGLAANGLNIANDVALTGTQDPVIDTGAFTGTLSGVISGTGFLTKEGSGTLVTTGANTYSGATVVAAGTLQAGAANTFSAASAMTVNAGATLNLAGHSQTLPGVSNAGVVSLAGTTPGTTLTLTGPWVGSNGTLRLGTALGGSASLSDRLILSGPGAIASGATQVQITNLGGLGAQTTGDGIEIISTTQGGSIQPNAFALAGGHVDAGAYEYRLNTTDKAGYLTSPVNEVPRYRIEASLYAALPSQLRQGNLAMLGNMRLRVGDDDVKSGTGAQSPGLAGGDRRAWGRVISADLDIQQRGTVSPTSKGRLSGFQAGTDLLAMPNWRAGLYVGQLDGDARVNGFASGTANLRTGSNDLRSQYLGIYGTYMSDGGFYADAVVQGGRHRYTVQPMSSGGIAGKGSSALLSIEAGQAFALGDSGWSVEPQLQLIHQRLSLDDASLVGALVRQDAESGWIARAGVRVKGEIATGAGALQPYGRFNVYRTSKGTDVARFMTPAAITDVASSTGGTSTELAGGFTLALNSTTSLYGEVGKLWSSGGAAKVRSSVNGSLGVRVRW